MISVVSTVRAPRADLERFVAYNLNTGVDRVRLFFDDPADPALPAFLGRPRVEVTVCTPQHWADAGVTPADGIEARQIHNAGLALARARAAGDNWLLHIDVDELVHAPGGDLAAWLGRRAPEVDAVCFPVWEAFPASAWRGHPFEACRLFKTAAPEDLLAKAARLGCRAALRYGYFCGHRLGKMAMRVGGACDHIAIHAAGRLDGGAFHVEAAPDAVLLHYDSCTFESWREKWARRKDGSGLLHTMRPSRRAQFHDFLAADASGSPGRLRREFRRQRKVPAHERAVLRSLGLARRVRLPGRLFEPPA